MWDETIFSSNERWNMTTVERHTETRCKIKKPSFVHIILNIFTMKIAHPLRPSSPFTTCNFWHSVNHCHNQFFHSFQFQLENSHRVRNIVCICFDENWIVDVCEWKVWSHYRWRFIHLFVLLLFLSNWMNFTLHFPCLVTVLFGAHFFLIK